MVYSSYKYFLWRTNIQHVWIAFVDIFCLAFFDLSLLGFGFIICPPLCACVCVWLSIWLHVCLPSCVHGCGSRSLVSLSCCQLLTQLKGNMEEETRHLVEQNQSLARENRALLERSLESRDQHHLQQREYLWVSGILISHYYFKHWITFYSRESTCEYKEYWYYITILNNESHSAAGRVCVSVRNTDITLLFKIMNHILQQTEYVWVSSTLVLTLLTTHILHSTAESTWVSNKLNFSTNLDHYT